MTRSDTLRSIQNIQAWIVDHVRNDAEILSVSLSSSSIAVHLDPDAAGRIYDHHGANIVVSAVSGGRHYSAAVDGVSVVCVVLDRGER